MSSTTATLYSKVFRLRKVSFAFITSFDDAAIVALAQVGPIGSRPTLCTNTTLIVHSSLCLCISNTADPLRCSPWPAARCPTAASRGCVWTFASYSSHSSLDELLNAGAVPAAAPGTPRRLPVCLADRRRRHALGVCCLPSPSSFSAFLSIFPHTRTTQPTPQHVNMKDLRHTGVSAHVLGHLAFCRTLKVSPALHHTPTQLPRFASILSLNFTTNEPYFFILSIAFCILSFQRIDLRDCPAVEAAACETFCVCRRFSRHDRLLLKCVDLDMYL